FTEVAGQTDNAIVRLNPDGSLDAGFHAAGTHQLYAIAPLPDGRVVVGGNFIMVDEGTSYLARLHTDGSIDGTFGANPNDDVMTVAVQPDGKLLVGGMFTAIGAHARNRIARLHPDGN